MSINVETSFVQQYKENVTIALQQRGSKLADKVRTETQTSEYDYYDEIGATEAQRIVGRHQDTPLVNSPHSRRRVGMSDYDWADLIDKKDKVRMLIDPTSAYSINAVYALGRAKDDEVIQSFFGNAYTGKDGSTTVSFDSNQVIPVNLSGSNEGLTVGKLIETKRKFLANEVDLDFDELYFAYTSKQLANLLATTQVTSSDYNSVKALVEGKVDTFMGFKFVSIERLLTDANGYRRCVAWAKSGVLLSTGEEINVDIGPRKDKRNAVQIYANMTAGATRMNEKKVVEIKCLET